MVQQIHPRSVAEKIQAGVPLYFVDVRHAWEHEIVRLAESVLIPLPELPARLDEVQPPAGAEVIVYCHHGIRSLSGASILESAGIPAASLMGGIDAWSDLIDPSLPKY